MLKAMTTYLEAEKLESLLFVAVGILAIALAIWLWTQGHRLKTMAYPLVAVAAIQLVVGSTVFLRTDAQISTLSQQFTSAPAQFRAEESQRMDVVMKNFTVYRYAELALLVLAMGLLAWKRDSDVLSGIAIGLLLQSGVMLTLDIFAETRGADYIHALRTMVP